MPIFESAGTSTSTIATTATTTAASRSTSLIKSSTKNTTDNLDTNSEASIDTIPATITWRHPFCRDHISQNVDGKSGETTLINPSDGGEFLNRTRKMDSELKGVNDAEFKVDFDVKLKATGVKLLKEQDDKLRINFKIKVNSTDADMLHEEGK
ncbi:hypothetical protein HELRODRAFT_184584 [Helobdella robusta]|uniref:Uncharacterized protein n=1 Tax=Helobdella robusta TaxID=6412 RepID=T1FLJ1_HELRO|nr:hypothetical protein HELRODRAFT_184584 [Helobdella robusta]ESO09193.1 hypothetical protein HELRODRAFT_184584 [Helobdella robusta]